MSSRQTDNYTGAEIAVVGMAGRFPGARNVGEFWQNLRAGVESITFFTDEEVESDVAAAGANAQLVKARGILEGVELFDAAFFGYSPRDAEILDPQHRLFLECGWVALEDAGHDPSRSRGPVGVYAGASQSSYLLFNLLQNPEVFRTVGSYQVMLATDKDYLTTRLAYKLGLEGPAVGVQTACSTSLVAVHFACQGLLGGDCDVALAGGVSINLPQKTASVYREGGITSPDGHCRAYDAQAAGTVGGNGVGVVVLKRLSDALADGDHVRAVIRGSAVNNDGGSKVGFTAPRADGQAKVIRAAHIMAEVAPETITYVEGHGTATPLGDPIEVEALTKAFRASTDRVGYCALGSVKSNIGHLDAAAGVAGLIKTVLMLEHGEFVPSLHFTEPNPKTGLTDSPFFVAAERRAWESNGAPRRAGVSSFGIGGTNAHVVLEEAPPVEPSAEPSASELLVLSAKTPAALEALTADLAAHLRRHPELNLADVAYTFQVGRRAFSQRRFLVCKGVADAAEALETRSPARLVTRADAQGARPVAFMFPGQGAQHVGMSGGLYETQPVFREQLDRCAELLAPQLDLDLREFLYPTPERAAEAAERLNQTFLTQPALFAVEYALARLWMSWGVRPEALAGHSVGEYVAACLAGVFSLEDALALVAYRARLMQALPKGEMLSVMLTAEELEPYLSADLSLAAINGPSQCVLSGTAEGVEGCEALLAARGVKCRRLHTSHAFHSRMMEPALEPFARRVAQTEINAPSVPYLSNLTGTWVTAEEVRDPSYWARHLRGTVRFGENLRELSGDGRRALLEVGPGRTLSALAARQERRRPEQPIVNSLPHPEEQQTDLESLTSAVGRLWLSSVAVETEGYHAGRRRRRLPLPTYPFERQRYWVEPQTQTQPHPVPAHSAHEAPASEFPSPNGDGVAPTQEPKQVWAQAADSAPRNEIERSLHALWKELLGVETLGIYDNFFELGGHSLMATQLVARLQETVPVRFPLNVIFTTPTIAELAAVIEERLLELIEELPEDEAERLAATVFGH
jgi:phthiocerol/phenolphthiocerol synthesis type-I polyketide synthase E